MKPARSALSALFGLALVAGLSGCATSYAPPPVVVVGEKAVVAEACPTCRGDGAGWSIAVTRPAACNDYPVSYRVPNGDSESRIRSVEKLQIVSDGGSARPAVSSCCK